MSGMPKGIDAHVRDSAVLLCMLIIIWYRRMIHCLLSQLMPTLGFAESDQPERVSVFQRQRITFLLIRQRLTTTFRVILLILKLVMQTKYTLYDTFLCTNN